MKPMQISRRTVLKGVGAALALPVLEAMLPRHAGAGTSDPPLRMAFLYVPNGAHMADWTPKQVGRDFELPPILRPLQSVKNQILVLSGLALDAARPHGDGSGDHARAMATFLTGQHPRKTPGADLRAGISVDQLAAQKIGQATRFASLELGCEGGPRAGICDNGYSCAYQTNLSWRSESMPMAKEIDPRLAFERLFGNHIKNETDASQNIRARHRKSILDFVADDAGRLRTRLGAGDKRKLDEYLTGVREIEDRISRLGPVAIIGKKQLVPPAGIPADYQEHLRLMSDILTLAFQADLTRIATFVFANDGSNRSYRSLGVAEGHHDLSHHGGDKSKQEKIAKINSFHVSILAHLIDRLHSTPEGDGPLLDHCMIVYGSGISDGDAHNHDNLPILLAGRGNGTLELGRHVVYPKDTPLMNLYVSLLDRLGVPMKSIGDSTGRLPALEG